MDFIIQNFHEFLTYTGFANATAGNLIMILVGAIFIWLAINIAVFYWKIHNWNTGYGGAEVGVSYPITKHVRFYTQVYSGYGESLIDYNFNQTRVGVGVMLNDLF